MPGIDSALPGQNTCEAEQWYNGDHPGLRGMIEPGDIEFQFVQ
jgi:hypothetical protein